MSGVILVLSGGGAKAAAHCGAVRALRERGIEPTRYVATSLGAVVAAALASGAEPDTVVRALMNEAPAGIRPHPLAAVAGIHLEGLVRARPFREAIGRIITARSFAELKVPLTVTAVDVDKLELVTLRARRHRRAAARRAGGVLRTAALLPGGSTRRPDAPGWRPDGPCSPGGGGRYRRVAGDRRGCGSRVRQRPRAEAAGWPAADSRGG